MPITHILATIFENEPKTLDKEVKALGHTQYWLRTVSRREGIGSRAKTHYRLDAFDCEEAVTRPKDGCTFQLEKRRIA